MLLNTAFIFYITHQYEKIDFIWNITTLKMEELLAALVKCVDLPKVPVDPNNFVSSFGIRYSEDSTGDTPANYKGFTFYAAETQVIGDNVMLTTWCDVDPMAPDQTMDILGSNEHGIQVKLYCINNHKYVNNEIVWYSRNVSSTQLKELLTTQQFTITGFATLPRKNHIDATITTNYIRHKYYLKSISISIPLGVYAEWVTRLGK
jgi:hypothetical protein